MPCETNKKPALSSAATADRDNDGNTLGVLPYKAMHGVLPSTVRRQLPARVASTSLYLNGTSSSSTRNW
eukprot:9939748-Lingulodinium_polyedra.AAC.1